MNKLNISYNLFLGLVFLSPTYINGQPAEVFRSKLGTSISGFSYSNKSSSISPALQLSYSDIMIYSVGPLFKTDMNYKTTGLDFSSRLRLGNCKDQIEPVLDWNLQFFKTKTPSDSIQKNVLMSIGFGFYAEMKIISISTTIGYGLNAIDFNNDLCFFKISVGFPNLYKYKSLIQPRSKHHSKSG